MLKSTETVDLNFVTLLFYSKEDDWGFAHFISWKDLINPEKGYVKDDAITLEAHVVAEAPHGVAWDSKKHTGCVGNKHVLGLLKILVNPIVRGP